MLIDSSQYSQEVFVTKFSFYHVYAHKSELMPHLFIDVFIQSV